MKITNLPEVPMDPKKLKPNALYILKIEGRVWPVKMNLSRTGLTAQNNLQGTTLYFSDNILGTLHGPFNLTTGENQ